VVLPGRCLMTSLRQPYAVSAAAHAEALVDVVERLMHEFEHRLPLDYVSGVVLGCQRDISGTSAGALPEMLERLARQRLVAAAGNAQD
jgi:hypothetical protein